MLAAGRRNAADNDPAVAWRWPSGRAGARHRLAGEQAYHIAYQDRLVTDVFINGRGPYTFLIDTRLQPHRDL